jgi:hypothetical protein
MQTTRKKRFSFLSGTFYSTHGKLSAVPTVSAIHIAEHVFCRPSYHAARDTSTHSHIHFKFSLLQDCRMQTRLESVKESLEYRSLYRYSFKAVRLFNTQNNSRVSEFVRWSFQEKKQISLSCFILLDLIKIIL